MGVTASAAIAAFLITSSALAAPPSPHSDPFKNIARQASSRRQDPGDLQVDLGYEIYEGYHNDSANLDIWKGIRFAAPPLDEYRWQAPQPPAQNRSNAIDASEYGPVCPQSPSGGSSLPSDYGDEDCLFLNVWAPPNAENLPVYVWIHGGGYGQGSGQLDMSPIINDNDKNFIGVAIQYRLGAFGFLSSDEVFRNGVVNAGILDQTFALKWVQTYIHLFGGNSSQVTISGESAGGGAVMLQTMAYGGSLGTSLFENAHASSPYLPQQYGYADWIPTQSYFSFASYAGCFNGTPYGFGTQYSTIFNCLIDKDTQTLQNASFSASSASNTGIWAFLPVTDGVFIQDLPSVQLNEKRVNGRRALIGNNADEGAPFVPQNITTEDDLVDWLKLTFPLFKTSDLAKVLLYYPTGNASTDVDSTQFATNGLTGADANNVSIVYSGQQQRASNIYAETTFVCPSYWMAQAFSDPPRQAYKYQYSVIPGTHGQDVSGFFGPAAPYQGPDFVSAFMNIIGNFATQNNPSISLALANGASSSNTSASNTSTQSTNPTTNFPQFDIYSPVQINLNQTGGTPTSIDVGLGEQNVTAFTGPGLRNDFTAVNAYEWEDGRGYRCDFWRSVGALVPE